MSLLVTINGIAENWSPAAWAERFSRRMPDRPVIVWPAKTSVDLAAIRYAAVWKPEPGLLARFPNLGAIFNLGAGVDAVLKDTTIPAHIPLVRVVNPDLTARMTEYVVLHTLMHFRRQHQLMADQSARFWNPREQPPASAVRVGILGFGELGQDAAEVLQRIGFKVSGWSRSPKTVPGVTCHSGASGLKPFLASTDILVALLPLTPDTRGILDRALFTGLARDGALGGPVLINAGRGGLQVEADIVSCLDDGTLAAATLDVFDTEPLPVENPLWAHPKITITPHNAADSSPEAITDYIADQIRNHEAGNALRHVVDRAKGY